MERDAVRIARKKVVGGDADGAVRGPRLGTGGRFSGIFLWDTAFTVLWARYHRDTLPVGRSLDNLYRLQSDRGFICRQYTADGTPVWPDHHPISFAPPILTWAELDLYELSGDLERLHRVYPHLRKHHQFCVDRFRADDGLFIGDPWGTGMDNLPRWPRAFSGDGEHLELNDEQVHPRVLTWFKQEVATSPGSAWNRQGRYIDLSAQMAFNADCLARMAVLIDAPDDAKSFSSQRTAIGEAINERCWSDQHNFYFDLGFGKQIPRYHIGAYWTLLAGIVPEQRLDGFLAHLVDDSKFARPVPVPSLAFDDPDYRPDGDYWRGSSWPPTTYMVLRGLRVVGAEDLAREIAVKYYGAVRTVYQSTGTFWENLAPESPAPGNPAQPDFCGWAGLGPVAVAREFIDHTRPG